MRRQNYDKERVNKQLSETTKVNQGYELQASCGSEPLTSRMKTPGEAKGSWSTRETTQANIQDPLLFYTRIKNCNKEGEGWGTHVKKSSSTKTRAGGEKKTGS